jgi:GNAT superfamily N-acetyltransferase
MMAQPIVRAAIAADIEFLREMLYLALFVSPGSPPFPRSILDDPAIDRYIRDWPTRPGDVGLIAVVDGVPVGAAWLRRFTADAPGYGFVDAATPELTVAVLEAYRNRGIGTRLIAGLQDRVLSISLNCELANPARRLYQRAGFKQWRDDERTMIWSASGPPDGHARH